MTSDNIQKILAPVDLGEASINALQTAMAITKNSNSLLEVLYVEETVTDFYSDSPTTLSANAGNILTATVNAFQTLNGLKPRIIKEQGNVFEIVSKKIYNEKFDLVVLGTYGESGHRNDFIGNTAYNIIKYATCTVLVIPFSKNRASFKKAILPVRPSSGAVSASEIICDFLRPDTKLELVGLVNKAEEKTKFLETLIKRIKQNACTGNTEIHTSWSVGLNVADNILKMAGEVSADLLIVTSAIDVTTKPFFIGPHTQRIINHARIPVLCRKKPGTPSFE